jgi:hypothetical protein
MGLLLVLLSCTSSAVKDATTGTNPEAVIEVIKPLVKQLRDASEKTDMKGAITPYWDSPDFCLVSNGQLLDYSDLVKGNREYFNFIKAQKFITREEKYLVLSPEIVLLNWSGKVEAELKDGQSFRADPIAISLLFKKIDHSHWKVVYTNESMPIQTDASK